MKKGVLVALFFLGCAKFGPPGGGPEDKTAPEVVSVSPVSGAVGVDCGAFFEFVFSEKVERSALSANVFISPPLPDSFHDELKGKVYRIYPNRFLRKATTYVVTLGTGVRDLHGNPLAQAYSFSFSTGAAIDSGEIAGQVFDKTAPVSQVSIKVFRMADTAAGLDWQKPDYQTASGKDGRFKFSFLPAGRYRLLASTGQKFGLYHRDVLTSKVGEKAHPAQIFLEVLDTSGLQLLDARMNADRLLVLTFNRALDFSDTTAASFEIFTSKAGGKLPAHSVFLNPNQKEKLFLAADFPAEEEEGLVRFRALVGRYGREGGDSASFLIGAKPDKTPPKPIYSEPSNRRERMGLADTIRFYFSEPVTANFEVSKPGLLDSTNAAAAVVWLQPQPNAFFFVPQNPLRQGEWYRFRFPSGAVKDGAGNLAADSVIITFRTYFSDSLGTVLGRFPGGASGKIVLEFRELRSGWTKTAAVADSAFSLPVLAGKYFLSGFVDRNENQKRDGGSLAPFSFPEPAFFYPDTVFVRARFETEGIEIKIP